MPLGGVLLKIVDRRLVELENLEKTKLHLEHVRIREKL